MRLDSARNEQELGYAKSIVRDLFAWMELRFLYGGQLSLSATTAVAGAEKIASKERHAAPAGGS
jgi:hypothetical protein